MRYLWISLGWLSLLVGIIGAVLPLIPTTPLLLLSAFSFSKSSPTFESWLKSTALYRYYAADFSKKGAIPLKRKRQIVIQIYILMGISIYFVQKAPLRLMLLILTAWITWYLFNKIPTASSPNNKDTDAS